MRLRPLFTQLFLAGMFFLAEPITVEGSEEAMLQLFKILHDRGSITDEEYQQLSELSDQEHGGQKKAARKAALNRPALDSLDGTGKPAAGPGPAKKLTGAAPGTPPRQAPTAPGHKPAEKWYEHIKIDGYTQFRYTQPLNDEGENLNVPADRSVDKNESLVIRRGRFKISGDITRHLYLYSQFDFTGSVFGSGGSFGLQARDLYGDISFDKEHTYRVRLGLSKVPFGWVNMQSSQNRAPLERPDGLNSAVEGERDQGVYFMFDPSTAHERFRELVKLGLKGSGDYGVLTLGAYGGQGLNRADVNGQPHVLARATYPWKLPNGQFIETAVNGYYGKFVSGTRAISVNGANITPDSPEDGVTDERIGLSFILYPQPFGLEAEWNWGRGPELSADRQSIGTGSLHGGYVQANYRLKTTQGELFPFARWNYYNGARKFAANAPRDYVNEIDLGFEFSPWPELELTLMYTHTFDRTNTNVFPYRDVQGADRLGLQAQWNY